MAFDLDHPAFGGGGVFLGGDAGGGEGWKITHLSLFSGIGGLDLAAEWAGFQTVGQCEWADYPTKVLEKHWPDVPRWRDIRDLTADDFRRRTGIDRPTIISGGFPCQPFSVAGKQKGKGDDRYLWPEMLRVIRELAPRWVVGENVPGILRIAADDVCQDLERIGYEVGIFDFEAAAVGALHRRERIAFVATRQSRDVEDPGCCGCGESGVLREQPWGAESIGASKAMAHAKHNGLAPGEIAGCTKQGGGSLAAGQVAASQSPRCSSRGMRSIAMADAKGAGIQRCADIPAAQQNQGSGQGQSDTAGGENVASNTDRSGRTPLAKPHGQFGTSGVMRSGWWSTEPDVGRVAHGVPARVDRLKCLGNAVVPQQFYPIFRAIAELEQEAHNEAD